ncbi:uncharacterized protein LTR77_009534 [Saxophila tyrrhenica]|uniref:Uncharacterized protein n=1 Tax=Saxophila tyrrhenica TaxID=1690608 RepID=A0AAV9NYN7_9PEZI|nr:hypothetical protein LTR77_009534 [Saxophila tyrrhenica]
MAPSDWTDDENEMYRSEFERLASLWHKQPYDLYHRPFSLLNIVPDLYWDVRKERDEPARRKSRKSGQGFTSTFPGQGRSEQWTHWILTTKHYFELRQTSTYMSPQGTLAQGLEKYALRRKFFITKKGYFGLGPSNVRPSDRIAVLFGVSAPIVMRTEEAGSPGKRVIGEIYVHDIMHCEVIEEWQNGHVEAGKILLR